MKFLIVITFFSLNTVFAQGINKDVSFALFQSSKSFKYKYNALYEDNREDRNVPNLSVTWNLKFKKCRKEELNTGIDTIRQFVKIKSFDYDHLIDSIDAINGNGYEYTEDSVRRQLNAAFKDKDEIITVIKKNKNIYVKYKNLNYQLIIKPSLKSLKKARGMNRNSETLYLIEHIITSFDIQKSNDIYKYLEWDDENNLK